MSKKTLDIATQKDITFITQVKNNQKTLLENIQFFCESEDPIETPLVETEKGHGRIESR